MAHEFVTGIPLRSGVSRILFKQREDFSKWSAQVIWEGAATGSGYAEFQVSNELANPQNWDTLLDASGSPMRITISGANGSGAVSDLLGFGFRYLRVKVVQDVAWTAGVLSVYLKMEEKWEMR